MLEESEGPESCADTSGRACWKAVRVLDEQMRGSLFEKGDVKLQFLEVMLQFR